MATIEQRLKALEQQQSDAPLLIIILRDTQKGVPTPEQQAQIAQVEAQGCEVRIIRIVCAEDLSEEELRQYG